jgi:hypothetical protein
MDRKTTATTIGSNYFDQFDPDNQMSIYTLVAKVIYKTPVDAQIQEWLDDTRHWLNLAEEYATTGHWPMNDKACHQYGGCQFRMICSKSPEVRERFLESYFHRVPWNPLVPR